MEKKKNTELDELVLKAQKGDSDAFGKIYDELVKPVYRYIFYRVEKEVAEDLTEDVFFKVWENLNKYKKGKHPFTSWVFRIAHNLVVDYYRKNKQYDEIDENIVDDRDSADPEKTTNIKLTNITLRKVIKKLPDNYREVIILKYVNELDNTEISSALNKSESSIRTIQFRALEKLRGMIGKKDELF